MRMAHYFNQSAGVLLLAMGLGLFLSHWASWELALPRDPLLLVSLRTLHTVVGMAGVILAAGCLFGKRISFQVAGVMWLAMNFWIYVIGLRWSGVPNLQGLLGSASEAFGLSRQVAVLFVQVAFGYLLIGSLLVLSWLWMQRGNLVAPGVKADLKMSCLHCGGHISFPESRLEQKISCPHCEKVISLQKPGNLKMSCFFCQGHIEFPSHAVGEKMPCPHCNKDITLKTPAGTA